MEANTEMILAPAPKYDNAELPFTLIDLLGSTYTTSFC